MRSRSSAHSKNSDPCFDYGDGAQRDISRFSREQDRVIVREIIDDQIASKLA